MSPKLEAVCLKAMSKDPRARYESMAGLAETLESVARHPTQEADTSQENALSANAAANGLHTPKCLPQSLFPE